MRSNRILKQCDINQELRSYLKFATVFTFFGLCGLLLSISLSVNMNYFAQIILPFLFIVIAIGFGIKPLYDTFLTQRRRKRALEDGVRVSAVVVGRRKTFNLLKGISTRFIHQVQVQNDNGNFIFEIETSERFLKPFTRYEVGEEIKGFVDFTTRAFFFPKELNEVA